MTLSSFKMLSMPWLKNAYRDNETAEQIAAREAAEAAAKAGGNSKLDAVAQAEINRLLAVERKKHSDQIDKLTKDLEIQKSGKGISVQEKERLEQQIEALKNSTLTEKELQQKEYKKEQDKLHKEILTKEEESKGWKSNFETYLIEAELSKAAADNKAVKASQIVGLFQQHSKVSPLTTEDGEVVPGKFVVKTSVKVGDKVLELAPSEAMKQLKESEDYANLFESDGSGGIGAKKSKGNNPPVDLERAFKDSAYYDANRPAIQQMMAGATGTKT